MKHPVACFDSSGHLDASGGLFGGAQFLPMVWAAGTREIGVTPSRTRKCVYELSGGFVWVVALFLRKNEEREAALVLNKPALALSNTALALKNAALDLSKAALGARILPRPEINAAIKTRRFGGETCRRAPGFPMAS
jgi:hypothetical protein